MGKIKKIGPLTVLAGALVLSPFSCRGEVYMGAHLVENSGAEIENMGAEIEDRVSRVRERIAMRYVDIYFEEGREKIDSVDDLVEEKGLEKAKKVFYDIEDIPFRIIREEIDLREGVSDMVNLYEGIDDRMNWKSKYIIKEFKGEIEYKIGLYNGKIGNGEDRLNRDDVSGLLEHSENILDGIKKELAADMKKYTKFVPFVGEAVILYIADKKMDASRKVVRKTYDRMLEE